MKILNIQFDDYANYGYENHKALVSVGIEAKSLKRVKHSFGYSEESKIASTDEIKREINKADIVQLFHSDSTWLHYANELGKKVYVYHTGTTYRQNSIHCNNIFNPFVEAAFTDQCEFIGLGMKNEAYVATAIDTDKFKMIDRNIIAPYKVAHYPSNPNVKGTAKINEMMKNVFEQKEYVYSDLIVRHNEQIERMRDCEIYVELFQLQQAGKSYGCFGVTAFEAASLGKIVFTNNIRNDVYEGIYGKSPFQIVNSEEKFISKMNDMLSLSPKQIYAHCLRASMLIEKNHSYQATGERLINLLKI